MVMIMMTMTMMVMMMLIMVVGMMMVVTMMMMMMVVTMMTTMETLELHCPMIKFEIIPYTAYLTEHVTLPFVPILKCFTF